MMKFRINRVGETITLEVDGLVQINEDDRGPKIDIAALMNGDAIGASLNAVAAAQGEGMLRSAARTAASELYGKITGRFRREFLRGIEEAVVLLAPTALGRGTRDPSEALTAYLHWDSSGPTVVVPETPPTPQSTQSEG